MKLSPEHVSHFLQKRVDFLQLMVDSQTEGKTEHGSSEEHPEKGEASQNDLVLYLKKHSSHSVLCRSE